MLLETFLKYFDTIIKTSVDNHFWKNVTYFRTLCHILVFQIAKFTQINSEIYCNELFDCYMGYNSKIITRQDLNKNQIGKNICALNFYGSIKFHVQISIRISKTVRIR